MTQANPSHPYTLASRSKSLPASQNLPKSMVAQTHGRKESTGIQHCIKAIAGEVVKLSSVHLINFGGGGQVIALKSATALILDRYLLSGTYNFLFGYKNLSPYLMQVGRSTYIAILMFSIFLFT